MIIDVQLQSVTLISSLVSALNGDCLHLWPALAAGCEQLPTSFLRGSFCCLVNLELMAQKLRSKATDSFLIRITVPFTKSHQSHLPSFSQAPPRALASMAHFCTSAATARMYISLAAYQGRDALMETAPSDGG